MHYVKPECAVNLELLLIEKLITRRLVRETTVAPCIVPDVIVLVTGQRSLDIHQVADLAAAIVDRADCRVRPGLRTWRAGLRCAGRRRHQCEGGLSDRFPRQRNANAEVDSRKTLEAHERRKMHGDV